MAFRRREILLLLDFCSALGKDKSSLTLALTDRFPFPLPSWCRVPYIDCISPLIQSSTYWCEFHSVFVLRSVLRRHLSIVLPKGLLFCLLIFIGLHLPVFIYFSLSVSKKL